MLLFYGDQVNFMAVGPLLATMELAPANFVKQSVNKNGSIILVISLKEYILEIIVKLEK